MNDVRALIVDPEPGPDNILDQIGCSPGEIVKTPYEEVTPALVRGDGDVAPDPGDFDLSPLCDTSFLTHASAASVRA